MKHWPVPEAKDHSVPLKDEGGSFWENRGDRHHCGVDIYAPKGAKVVSVDKGKVVRTGVFTTPKQNHYWNKTYFIIIKDKKGYYWKYAELGKILVKKGDSVKGTQQIGEIGQVLNNKNISENAPKYVRRLEALDHLSMLHIELHTKEPKESNDYMGGNWFGDVVPDDIMDPSQKLGHVLGIKIDPRHTEIQIEFRGKTHNVLETNMARKSRFVKVFQLIAPLVIYGLFLLIILGIFPIGKALQLYGFFGSYYLPLAGKESIIPMATKMGIRPVTIALGITVTDSLVCLFLLWNLDYLKKVPVVGIALIKTEELGTKLAEKRVRKPLGKFLLLVGFIAFPLKGTGGIAGTLLGLIMGMNHYMILLGMFIASFFGCLFIGYVAEWTLDFFGINNWEMMIIIIIIIEIFVFLIPGIQTRVNIIRRRRRLRT